MLATRCTDCKTIFHLTQNLVLLHFALIFLVRACHKNEKCGVAAILGAAYILGGYNKLCRNIFLTIESSALSPAVRGIADFGLRGQVEMTNNTILRSEHSS